MPPYLRLDVLIPFMPDAVLAEIRELGDPDMCGWGPTLKHWLTTSENPRVAKWRNDLRKFVRRDYKLAERRQLAMIDIAKEFYANSRGTIRHAALLDPAFRDYNEHCFKGQKAIGQERRDSPKIFINT